MNFKHARMIRKMIGINNTNGIHVNQVEKNMVENEIFMKF